MEVELEKELLNADALKEGCPSNLIGTTWLVSNNNYFCPFDITFDANNIGKAVSTNKYFYGTCHWHGNESSAIFIVHWNNGSTFACHANLDQGNGTMHYQFRGHTYVWPFKVNKQ